MSFFDLSTSTGIGQAVPVDNVAQLLTSSTLSPGAHAIAAIFEGDANLAASSSPTYIENITQATTTTTLSTSASPTVLGQALTLVATIQPSASTGATGAVLFQEGSTILGVASVSNNQATFAATNLAVGSHVITAQYSGDTNYSGSTSAALTETVTPAASATAVSSSLNPAAFGQTVTFTATIQPPAGMSATGTVTFLDGTATIGAAAVSGNSAQVTASGLSVGAHAITAAYSGDTNLLGSTSTVLTQTVNPTATTTLMSATPTSSTYGQAVSLHASVTTAFGGSPTGTVAFFDGATEVGTATVSDTFAQLTLPGGTLAAGSHSVTARYSGDANFAGSASAAFATTVTAAFTSTTLNSSPDPALLGQVVTFTAAVSSTVAGAQSGTVSFFIDGSPAPAASVSVSGGTAQFSTNSLSASTHTVSAIFTSSNQNFQASSAAAIAQAVLDLAISASPSVLTVSRGHTGTYTITVSPINGFTGVVALSCSGVGPTDTCSISPAQVTVSGAGSVQATVTVTVSHKSTTGTRTLTFTATSGTLSHSTAASLTIK